MKRRSFLKMCGMALFAPAVAASGKSDVLTSDMIRDISNKALANPTVEPYYAMVHPDNYNALISMKAKNEYKHSQWVKRYNRWRQSKGESPNKTIVGEVGTFNS